jgi:capsular exopolysaccharide synthesis family protein
MQAPNPLREELVKELALAEAEVHRTSAQEAAFRSLTGQELAKLKEWPDVATQLGRLKRNAQVASELYVMLMKNYQQMRVNEAIASPGVTVVAQARLPEKPVSPRKKLNVALGGAVGLLLAFLLAALAEALDDRLRSAEETTRRVGLRALGAVPTTTDVAAYLAGEVESGELSDAFAALRVGVRAAAGAVPRVLLVSSAGALEGKSAIAVGLGLALARAGVRTLVVDGDLRREAEAKRLAFPSVGPGLSGVLRGEIEAESAVQPTWAEGLHFLPAGTIPDAPMELLDTPRAATALGALRGSHDCVLIDGPTFTGSTEARLLAGLCEGSLVVVDQTRTRAADVQATADGLSASGAIPLGLVLNRAGHTGPPGSRGRHAAGGALP